MTKKTERKEGIEWVIYSKRKNAVWGGGYRKSFLTREDAEIELARQIAMLTPELRNEVDWKVEDRHWHGEVYVKKTEDLTEGGWGDF